MAGINIFLNLILIPKYHVIGAAMSTFLSLTFFNLIKIVFVYLRFKMQPFSIRTLAVIGIGGLVFGLSFLIPDTGNHLLNIIVKSGLISLLYVIIVLRFRISNDINQLWSETLQKFGFS